VPIEPSTLRRLDNRTLELGTRELCRRDPHLRAVVRRWGVPPLWGRQPGFVTLLRIILEQQVSLASGNAMWLRLKLRLGEVNPGSVFALGELGLRELGFTRQKASYCHGLAIELLEGRLNLSLVGAAEDHHARASLVGLRGVGPWSADVYLLMALRRPDVWPTGDVALVQAMREVKGLGVRPSYDRADRMALSWSPWRAVGARILWHHYLSVRAARRQQRNNRA
jgi:DNA-3-methyladenine glycosylase II